MPHNPANTETGNPYLVGELPAELGMHMDMATGISARAADKKNAAAFIQFATVARNARRVESQGHCPLLNSTRGLNHEIFRQTARRVTAVVDRRLGPDLPAATARAARPGARSPMRRNCPIISAPRSVAPNGEQFGNVAAVALRPNGNLLVFNRNPAIMMVEYDPTGTKVLRVFNPNIAMNPHALRVDRHGNIWVIDSFLNVIFKLNPNGDVIRMFGIRGENAPWDDSQVERHVQPAAGYRLGQGRQFLCGAEPWRHLAARRLHLLRHL